MVAPRQGGVTSMTGKQRSAKTSRISINGTLLTFASYDITMSGDDLVTVNFQSYSSSAGQTYDEGILGKIGCKVAFGGDWDAGTNPLGTPPGLFPRDDLTNSLFYPSFIDAVDWSFTYLRVRGVKNSSAIADKVLFSVDDAMSQGPFVYPTGSV